MTKWFKMANLTRIAYYTRKAVVWGAIAIVCFFILKSFVDFGFNQWQKTHPSPTPAPNVLFGKLSKIKFPSSDYPYPQNFVLETVGGELPEASSSAKVYQIAKKLPSLLAPRHAQEFANRLGFTNPPISKTPTKYTFENPKNPLQTLDLDIVNFNFTLQYQFMLNRGVFDERNLPYPDQAKEEAIRFFQETGNFPADLQNGKQEVSFLKFTGQKLITTTSLSRAQAVRVDFFRSDVDTFSLLEPEFKKSSVFIVFSGSKIREERIVLAQFNYFEVNYQTPATYSIKTSQQAWEELKAGKAFIAQWLEGKKKVVIRKVYLAYLDLPGDQNFLQPIFVFEGDNDFIAYLPAVKDEWLE